MYHLKSTLIAGFAGVSAMMLMPEAQAQERCSTANIEACYSAKSGNIQFNMNDLQIEKRGNASGADYTLVYFGTSWKSPICGPNLGLMSDSAQTMGRNADVNIVYVYPDYGRRANQRSEPDYTLDLIAEDYPGDFEIRKGRPQVVIDMAAKVYESYRPHLSGPIKNAGREEMPDLHPTNAYLLDSENRLIGVMKSFHPLLLIPSMEKAIQQHEERVGVKNSSPTPYQLR